MKQIFFVIVVVVILGSFIYCFYDAVQRDIYATKKSEEAIAMCEKHGGLPIISQWTGDMTNCIFPPKKGETND